MISYMQNVKNDELYTPKYAVTPLLKYLPKDIKIWECTDFGQSNITNVLVGGGVQCFINKKRKF